MMLAGDEADLRWYFATGRSCTHSHVAGTRYVVMNENENTLRAARISRVLLHLHRQRPLSTPVLQAFYGMIGSFYATSRYGRLYALFPLTPLARRRFVVAARSCDRLSPYELIDREFEMPSAGLPELQRLFRASVEGQARRLHHDATTLYHRTRKRLCSG